MQINVNKSHPCKNDQLSRCDSCSVVDLFAADFYIERHRAATALCQTLVCLGR